MGVVFLTIPFLFFIIFVNIKELKNRKDKIKNIIVN
jgi:hypothetical protein